MQQRILSKKNSFHIPAGFSAGGISAGIKAGAKHDLGMIISETPVVAVATLTTNRFQAAPVQLCKKRLSGISRQIRGVIVNSGNANAMTGAEGLKHAASMAEAAEKAAGCPAGSFLVASTGIIGKPLPIQAIQSAAPRLAQAVSGGGWTDFAKAIMTTDLRMKISSRKVATNPEGDRAILGIAKGSGMIQPNMATMLAFVATDFPLPQGKARQILRQAVDASFNCLTVDGQTSTNDMVLMMSNEAMPRGRDLSGASIKAFEAALTEVCQDLAREIAIDGEGATKLVEISVAGTNSPEQARRVAMEVANSPLVKTALHGADPNWGRIVQAIGQTSVPFLAERTSIKIQGVSVVKDGQPAAFDRGALHKLMKDGRIEIDIRVGAGKGQSKVWTCDLSAEYVSINTAYN